MYLGGGRPHVVALCDERLDPGMNCLPDGEVHVHDPLCLRRVGRAGDGHVQAVLPPSGSDNPEVLQEFLQVGNEAWSIDEYVQAAVALRSGRNGVAFSHCGEERPRVKSCTQLARGESDPSGGSSPTAEEATWSAPQPAGHR